MNKLTQQEAQLVLQEAYRLKAQYADSKSRLGQSIWWSSEINRGVPYLLGRKLFKLLDENSENDVDFYHYVDDNDVLEVFYKHFVEAE